MHCPTRDEFFECLVGRSSQSRIEALFEHVEQCSDCQSIVESMDEGSDDVVQALRQSTEALQVSPDCEEMISQAEMLIEPFREAKNPKTTAHVPEYIRDYHILDPIGEGGMGKLYQATHTRLKRSVAIKLLATRVTQEASAISRFMREMEAVGKLEHENIVHALDAGEQDGLHYLVMELVDGLDLRKILKRTGTLSIANACEAARQAAIGLHSAHMEGLVHRDVKPSNLMISMQGCVKLLDLGLALLGSETSGELTSSQLAIGSVDYIAPEQADDSHGVTAKADIYSLGCTLYHLLCGRPPFFSGHTTSLIQRIKAHATECPARITEFRSDAPDELAEVLDRMLEKSPERRPADAQAVADMLQPFSEAADLAKLVRKASGTSTTAVMTNVEPTQATKKSDLAKAGNQHKKSPSAMLAEIKGQPAVVTTHESRLPAIKITTRKQLQLIEELMTLVSGCREQEAELRGTREDREQELQQTHDELRGKLVRDFESKYGKLALEYKKAKEQVESQFEGEGYILANEEQQFEEEATRDHTIEMEHAKQEWNDAHQKLLERIDATQATPQAQFETIKSQCDTFALELQSVEKQAEKIVRRRGCGTIHPLPQFQLPSTDRWKQESIDQVAAALETTRQQIVVLHDRRAARFNETGWPMLLFFLFGILAALGTWLAWPQYQYLWIGVGVGVGLFLAIIVRQVMRSFGKKQTLAVLPEVQKSLGTAHTLLRGALESAHADAQRKHSKIKQERDEELDSAKAAWAKTRRAIKAKQDAKARKVTDRFQAKRKKITATRDRQTASLEQKYPPQLKQLEQEFETAFQSCSKSHREKMAASRIQFEEQWRDTADRWTEGNTRFREAIEQMNFACDRRFPNWDDVDWKTWKPVPQPLSALRFGQFGVSIASEAGEKLRPGEVTLPESDYSLPAVLSFPECPSILFKAEGEGREVAIQSIQNAMLRLLTSLPPGKVRFTILDPVGLGQNFSVFMHLADFDERLVTSRIWTESAHINKRLTDLTEHMENVIQKYLRNEFASIQEYNQQAGEVAEPFQILVVANFPANFNEESARRLVSIASTGARCGVYTLISTDTKMKLPRNFDLADLEANAATLRWNDDRYLWDHPELTSLPLRLDQRPADDDFTAAVRAVGQLAKDSSRVEVPFKTVIPPPNQWWSSDSRAEVEVPLGRAGATKLQYMRLGKGTSQHVLISGKTGSGKSTLLHAIITTLSVYYSPDEIQFYLIDFKKGVEFKAYASFSLPHARVIAIESEREFGMSVLERLDAELRERGDRFRSAGVQDIKAFRDANPDAVVPRILLIIDEFQELFVSDDKISQEAGLLLDRLVRQGRAFGIHVLLGSQTLAGAYSLARSTLGQMAVRVALQCSETDAHLILSEDNTAARLLNRPGEAIYNDANGMLEGNHPFQVVWLPDVDREASLRDIQRMAEQRGRNADPPIVFEGNVAADPGENRLLRKALQSKPTKAKGSLPMAWLGSAVAIKDPTCVSFRRQSGSNLLIVGQQEEMAMGILGNCLVSLAAQLPPDAASTSNLRRYYICDGIRPESPDSDFWSRFTHQTSIDAELVSPKQLSKLMARLAEEVDRRLQDSEAVADPIFVVLHNLSRFRDLRKSDEYSFSGFDEDAPASADKLFSTILREGPTVGIHAIIWCDSYNNLNRWIERQNMNDLELRILFQMGASDSSNLMDSPAASRLGVHRAMLYDEELGQTEKFRPYGPPSHDWLKWVADQLAKRDAN